MSLQTKVDEELDDAKDAVDTRRAAFASRSRSIAIILEVASLIFVAEWGDRSMLATVALAASQSAAGVTIGAVAGHGLATLMAVVGGALMSRYISEKVMHVVGGGLFLGFAATTAFGLLF